MSNKDTPAYPIPGMNMQSLGLTKLEAFTMAALQGLLANEYNGTDSPKSLACTAIDYAEAALAELEARG
jgi:hypothetical protein